jgi:hypothetical protein
MPKGSAGAFITSIAFNRDVPIPAIRAGVRRLGAVLASSMHP